MALTTAQQEQFTDAFTRALITSWSDEEYAARLESDSHAALAEAGLDLPADAQIVMVRNPDPGGDQAGGLEKQLGLYEQGLTTGRFEFHMPATPQVDTSELELDELADISGGMYCCCCPCCCCG